MKVKCINNSGVVHLTRNKHYIVEKLLKPLTPYYYTTPVLKVETDDFNKATIILVIGDGGFKTEYNANRFELVEEKLQQKESSGYIFQIKRTEVVEPKDFKQGEIVKFLSSDKNTDVPYLVIVTESKGHTFEGVVLTEGSFGPHIPGYYSNLFVAKYFTRFKGTLTIKQ